MSAELGSATRKSVDRPLSIDVPDSIQVDADSRLEAVASSALDAYVQNAVNQHNIKLAEKVAESSKIHVFLNKGTWNEQCFTYFKGKLDQEVIRDVSLQFSLSEAGMVDKTQDEQLLKLLRNAIRNMSYEAFVAIPIPDEARKGLKEELDKLAAAEQIETAREIYQKMSAIADKRPWKPDHLL